MGVHRLKQCLQQLCGNSVYKGAKAIQLASECDILLFDTNDLIHEALESVPEDVEDPKEYLFEATWSLLCMRMRLLQPKERVVFFFDGGAAVCKIRHQRERRLKRLLSGSRREEFRNLLTAGTPLMKEYEAYFAQCVWSLKCMWIGIQFSIDGTWNLGEGEHKIRDALWKIPKDKKVTIYGKDGDLLFISLLTQKDCMIFGGFGLVSTKQPVLYNTSELRQSLLKRYTGKRDKPENVIQDLCFLLLNLGNDYVRYNVPSIVLNHNTKFSSIIELIKMYASDDYYLVNYENLINLPSSEATPQRVLHVNNIIKLFEKFDQDRRYCIGHKKFKLLVRSSQFNVRKFVKDNKYATNSHICPETERFWRIASAQDVDLERKFKSWYSDIVKTPLQDPNQLRLSDDDKFPVALEYWKTMCWSLVTYTTGVPDWSHCYELHNAPGLRDLCNFLRKSTQDRQDVDITWKCPTPTDKIPYLTRLLSILPISTLSMLFPDNIEEIKYLMQEANVLPPEHMLFGGVPNVFYAVGITNLEHHPPQQYESISKAVFNILPEKFQHHFSKYGSPTDTDADLFETVDKMNFGGATRSNSEISTV